jgi:hypothetical protein
MDNTTLTIIGMIAAFITASLTPIITETIKNRTEHKNKMNSLRVALYKEMFHNYLMAIPANEGSASYSDLLLTERHAFRNECYLHALQNELALFYEMEETKQINLLQGVLLRLMLNLSSDMQFLTKKEEKEQVYIDSFADAAKAYRGLFAESIYKDVLKKDIYEKILAKDEFQELMDYGKKSDEATKKVISEAHAQS